MDLQCKHILSLDHDIFRKDLVSHRTKPRLELLTDFSSRSIVAKEERTLLRIPLTVPL